MKMRYLFALWAALLMLTGCLAIKEKNALFTFDDRGLTVTCGDTAVAVDSLSAAGEVDILVLTSYPDTGLDTLSEFLTQHEVDKLYLPPNSSADQLEKIVLAAADSEVDIYPLQRDTTVSEDDIKLTLHFPADPLSDAPKMALTLTHGKVSCVYLPDMDDSEIAHLVKEQNSPCHILKMPQGSYTKTTESLLQSLTPKHAVFCSNEAGTPDDRLLGTMENTAANPIKTEGGKVTFVSDKKEITLP